MWLFFTTETCFIKSLTLSFHYQYNNLFQESSALEENDGRESVDKENENEDEVTLLQWKYEIMRVHWDIFH